MKIQVSPATQVDRAALVAVLLTDKSSLKGSSAAVKLARAVIERGEWKPGFRESRPLALRPNLAIGLPFRGS